MAAKTKKDVKHQKPLPQSEALTEEDAPHLWASTWSLWFFKNDNSANIKDQWCVNQRQVASFNTVEEFWQIFNFIKPCYRLTSGCDYSIFREGIEPMWEHCCNSAGGRFIMSVKRTQSDVDKNTLQTLWTDIVLNVLGEVCGSVSNLINGVVVSSRQKQFRFAIWTSTKDEASMKRIGYTIFDNIIGSQNNLAQINPQMVFEAHADSRAKTDSGRSKQSIKITLEDLVNAKKSGEFIERKGL